MAFLRCGSVRFSNVVSPTVRLGATLCPTVRFGAVFRYRQTCGAVRCGFQESKNRTVRCGAVNRTQPIGKTAPQRTLIIMIMIMTMIMIIIQLRTSRRHSHPAHSPSNWNTVGRLRFKRSRFKRNADWRGQTACHGHTCPFRFNLVRTSLPFPVQITWN